MFSRSVFLSATFVYQRAERSTSPSRSSETSRLLDQQQQVSFVTGMLLHTSSLLIQKIYLYTSYSNNTHRANCSNLGQILQNGQLLLLFIFTLSFKRQHPLSTELYVPQSLFGPVSLCFWHDMIARHLLKCIKTRFTKTPWMHETCKKSLSGFADDIWIQ